MRILFTGGGTGGHFYPIIAVVEQLNRIIKENKLVNVELYFLSESPYNPSVLFDHNLIFKKNYAGKLRKYFSIMNFFDLFKTGWGILRSLWTIFLIYPDVMFGKGGYASFPAMLASRILRIPVIIHESDSVPGRANIWASKFAERIAVSYPEAAKYFPQEKVAYTGQPIREDFFLPLRSNAYEFLKLDPSLKTILIIGGSQGSQIINDAITESVPKLVENYQIIHQTGKFNFEEVQKVSSAVLTRNPNKERYKIYSYLDSLTLRSAAGIADLVISRAGSSIFEIAAWGIPSIIIQIQKSNGDHQIKNAFSYARTGAAVVIEEANLTGNIIAAEAERILGDQSIHQRMKSSTSSSVKKDAARKIAEEILKIALSHGE